MAPGSIPVPFPPARNIKSLSARLANIARTVFLRFEGGYERDIERGGEGRGGERGKEGVMD
eukprot:58887-Amorphochlora_amoeboformis.AAC.1